MSLFTTRWRVLFGAVALSGLAVGGAHAQNRTVTLRLNTASLPDTTKITEMIEIRGCLTGCTDNQSALPGGNVIAWDARTTLKPVNRGGDYWDVTFQVPVTAELNFKFYSPQGEAGPNATPRGSGIGGWEDGDNNTLAAGTRDTTYALHYFNKSGGNRAYAAKPWRTKSDSVAVWFRVYLATTLAEANGFDAATMPVGVRGDDLTAMSPLDWGTTKLTLTRESTDQAKPGYYMYSGVGYYPASARGKVQNYKFVFQKNATTIGWDDIPGGANRSFKVPSGTRVDTTLRWVYFGNTPAKKFGVTATATVNFSVNLSPLNRLGLFDRTRGDSIEIRGAFNGWDCAGEGAPDDCLMQIRTVGAAADRPISFVNTAVGSKQEYKYYIEFNDVNFRTTFGAEPPSGWEEDINSTGINRAFTFTGTNPQTIGQEVFNGIVDDNIILAGTSVATTWRVNMTPALTNAAQPFVPGTDSVFVRFEDPVWAFTNNARAAAGVKQYMLTRVGTTNVYAGTFPVRGVTRGTKTIGTYSGIAYKYNYGKNNQYVDEPGLGAGATPGRRRVRFIVPTGTGASLTWPTSYSLTGAGAEVFQVEQGALVFECNPAPAAASFRLAACVPSQALTGTAVEAVGGTPSETAISNVAPNPVRGTARFSYAVPTTGRVSLRVYDLLGREVATLVDAEQAASNYAVSFDTADLPAGVYVYRLQTGRASVAKTFVVTK